MEKIKINERIDALYREQAILGNAQRDLMRRHRTAKLPGVDSRIYANSQKIVALRELLKRL